MIVKTLHPYSSSTPIPFSVKRAFIFSFIFVLVIAFISGIVLLSVIFILKPQMPIFSLQKVNVESYKLKSNFQKLVVSSAFSLDFLAENPNKVALSYESSRFHVLNQGLVVGLIRIPPFHQPPLSKNVSIQSQVLLESVDIGEIVYGNTRKDDSLEGVFRIQILGDVGGHVSIFQMILPKIKVALDCDIVVKQSQFSSSKAIGNNFLTSLPLNSQLVSKKCSLAILV